MDARGDARRGGDLVVLDSDVDKSAMFDLTVDGGGGLDAEVDASADLGPLMPDLGNVGPGDTCYNPIPLTWQGEKAHAGGVMHPYATSRVTLPSGAPRGCVSGRTTGPEIFFSFTVPKDGRYVVGSGTLDRTVYVFTDCNDIVGSCLLEVDGPRHANSRLLMLRTSTTYIVAVDQVQTPSGPYIGSGVTVMPAPVPFNNTCVNAKPVTFLQGEAPLDVRFAFATDTNSAQQLDCPQGELRKAYTGGVDVFFRVPMKAGKAYRIGSPSGYPWSFAHVYIISDCGSAPTCLAGSYLEQQFWPYGWPRDPFVFHPPKTGDYILVADTIGTQGAGFGSPSGLQSSNEFVWIEERSTGPHDSCAGAQTIALAGQTKVTLKGDLASFLEDSYCRKGAPTPNKADPPSWKNEELPDAYYRLPTKLGEQYKLSCGGCWFVTAPSCDLIHDCQQSSSSTVLTGSGSDVVVRVEGKAAYALTVEVL